MAKAQITTPSGIKVKVEGTSAEISAVVQELERKESANPQSSTVGRAKIHSGRVTLASLLQGLRDEGYFNQPRDLGSTKSELETKGQFYPVTTLSGAVLSEVRKKRLRRLKKDGRWFYVRSG